MILFKGNFRTLDRRRPRVQAVAIDSYTAVPARFNGSGHELGSIAPGKRADIIILDRDIFKTDPIRIADTSVDLTVFDGKIVFHRK